MSKDERPELRLAIVMNGGVSLAVWMAGVTAELDRLRRSASSTVDPASAAWRKVVDASPYRSVAVDTIAGTSAGGINGVILASAVSRGRAIEAAALRELWIEAARLKAGALLRAVPMPNRSLLDGEYFHDQLRSALDGDSPMFSDEVAPEPVRLRVTATGLGRFHHHREASSGATVAVRDARRVWRFDLAACPPDTQTVDDLALAARASASYPIAFEPVSTTPSLALREDAKRGAVGEPLIDGGVMDNAPFEPVIDALKERRARAPFRRALLYVRPGVNAPDTGPDPGPFNEMLNLIGPLTGALREPDARLDFDRLDAQFDRMQFTASQPVAIIASTLETGSDSAIAVVAAATSQYRWYRAGRLQALGVPDPLTLWVAPSVATPSPAPSASVWDTVAVPREFNAPGTRDPWEWGIGTARRVLTWWSRLANEHNAGFEKRRHAMNTCADALAVVDGINAAYTDARTALGADATPAEQALALAACGAPGLTPVIAAAGEVVRDQLAPGSSVDLLQVTLAVEVMSSTFAWAGDESDLDPPTFAYHETTPGARADELLEGVGDTLPCGAMNQDAFLHAWPERKLYGERWGHFGAFADESYRRHDWLWGRLDAASSLASLVLGANADSSFILALRSEILADEGLDVARAREGAANAFCASPQQMWDRMRATWSPDDRQAVLALGTRFVDANFGSRIPESSSLPRTLLGLRASGGGLKERVTRWAARPIAWLGRRWARRRFRKMLDPDPR
jgi:predicted acylesterase/phospholipase RssA